ncbi:MAG TPA: carboxyl transferase domain-containing protein [Vicinamibacterales bacterium]|nr:carboxyl transferase domain-containing protein [Vicinamibacterales bacterium]HPW20830.1 carboxyl transferase domain-containing protein [Vicinamibacterales bacterium]
MQNDFHRVAIVNRGEPAMRFIHAVREYNSEHRTDIRVIALFTEPDRHARFVREADEAVDLGPSTFVDPRDGLRRPKYLDGGAVERALGDAQADAVWTGWGFLAERPEFAERCERLGLTVIGPDGPSMRRLGDKICAKRLAEQVGVPVVPWGGGPADTVDAALDHAQRLGYPVGLKPSGGAGGRSIRRLAAPAELERAFAPVRRDAARNFLDRTLFIERWMPGMRHIEVQIQADRHGTIWALGTRDCSLQRRFQKLAAEAPAVGLTPEVETALLDAAVRIVAAARYRDQASVEFLVDLAGRFYFLEANTRLQVEHVVTELTSGIDLVKLEIDVARGGRLAPAPPAGSGHAVEVRLNAEDPYSGFAASPGVVTQFRTATGPGLRVDTSIAEGSALPPEFGSLCAKLAAAGHTRDEALGRLKRALAESVLVVSGGPSNRTFLLQVFERAEVRRGIVDTGLLDRLTVGEEALSERHAKIALLQAAVEAYDAEHNEEVAEFFASAARLRPSVRAEIGRPVELSYRGHRYALRVHRLGEGRYRVAAGASRVDVEVEHSGAFERWLTTDGRRYRVLASQSGYTLLIEVEGVPHAIFRADEGIVRASSPAVVVSVHVQPGDEVAAGERLAVLEAMKMETAVAAPFAGTVRQVFVLPNSQVGAGAPLVHLDAARDERGRRAGPRVVFDGRSHAAARPGGRQASRGRALLHGVRAGLAEYRKAGSERGVVNPLPAMRAVMLGFDLDAKDVERLLQDYDRLTRVLQPDDPDLLRAEDNLLRMAVDLRAVFGRQAAAGAESGPSLGSEQHLLRYLRTIDAEGADLPTGFLEELQAALAHYGVTDLRPSRQLRESLLALFQANQRGALHAAIVRAVLERRLAAAPRLAPGTPAFLRTIERLIASVQAREAGLADLARDVHYRYVEQPAFERVRGAVLGEMLERLDRLALDPASPEASAWLGDLVACPYPLRTAVTARMATAVPAVRRAALEVMLRRDYRFRRLERLTCVPESDPPLVLAAYPLEGESIEVVATCGPVDAMASMLLAVREHVARLPADREVIAEIYVWNAQGLDDDAMAAALGETLEAANLARPLRRAVVMVLPRGEPEACGGLKCFTFRPSGPAYREDRVLRGLHPMQAKQLEFSRLERFFLERLPSVEDVYLFKGTARENPRDERLFALVEVRDATALRDAEGRLAAVPHLERMALEAFTAMRGAQLRRRGEDRLHWNRVTLFVRPPMAVSRPEIGELAARLSTHAEGLGLEKIVIRAALPGADGCVEDVSVGIILAAGRAPVLQFAAPSRDPLRTLSDYDQRVVRMRQRGLTYPYEIVRLMTPEHAEPGDPIPPGSFVELDLDASGALAPVDRPHGKNTANIVVGLLTNRTEKYPEGMTRVALFGDPSREVGSLAEPECRRIIGALDLAEETGVPLEWYALSAGAKISMESGTENMDWISRVLRRIVTFTQAGGEINIVVTGINVGAQPYWNAEATMLMHTRGILVMTAEGAMVLTGKMALDYSGSVSAEDNTGIGGYEHIMGPNGQAQYWARDLRDACRILLRHYDHTYRMPGERFPRQAVTTDPVSRDIRAFPHDGRPDGFATVGEVFSDETNPGRKRPFDIRRVMLAVADADRAPLERWAGWRDAEIAVTWDAHIGGYPVCLIGFESRAVPRVGVVPADGPAQWTSGTLFPMASKKVARAINAASLNRPVVILANLSGFDGSPESMRRRQLEFGAEIGRAVVNFQGPIVFVVVSRYHGGAFVVFSRALNENLEAAALEGSFASVIGGAPAAAVVFARDVDGRTRKDPRVREIDAALASAATDEERAALRASLADVMRKVRSEKLGEVADEFDRIHSVHRALEVGSLDRIISAAELRPYLVGAIERGIARELERWTACSARSS